MQITTRTSSAFSCTDVDRILIHNAKSFCKPGDIIEVNKIRYFVDEIRSNGDAILEIFRMTSKDTAIHDVSVKPKNYRSTYKPGHKRIW